MSDYTFKMPDPEIPSPTGEVIEQDENQESLTGQLLKALGMKNSLGRGATEIAIMQFPGIGEVLSATEAVNSFSKGNISDGLMYTAFAIPIVGGKIRLARTAAKSLGLAKKTNLMKKIGQAEKIANKAGKYAQYGINGYWGIELGPELYDFFIKDDEPSYIAEKDATQVKPSYSNFLEDLKKE